MDPKTVDAILAAVKRGFDVVISAGKNGELRIKTVQLKKLKIEDRFSQRK